MANVFFTSDIHLGHRGVLDFDNRPWDNLEDMNEGLIKRWNDKVGKGDRVYILGDLCWLSGEKAKALVGRLNGNLYLIRGNHD
ncbi:MAG: metallophosphoesterase, partial [Lachnospiraceae bacterium]|nr:metallophosphoesterase [Lachnospiraceae bacterium]